MEWTPVRLWSVGCLSETYIHELLTHFVQIVLHVLYGMYSYTLHYQCRESTCINPHHYKHSYLVYAVPVKWRRMVAMLY